VIIRGVWATRHGDSERSPAWAVVTDAGAPVDLTAWVVRAQMRATRDAPFVDYSFTAGDGIAVGTARIATGGRVITTSTIQLYLDPADWGAIPNPYTGILDVEMASDPAPSPAEVHTLVELEFTAEEDITRG
jgi:hypothetical protein